VVLLDHPRDKYDTARAFWSAALGSHPEPAPDGPYESFGLAGDVRLELQRTGLGTHPRVHFDIETDDVRAEVTRLLELGAEVVTEFEEYAILSDPVGLAFCVVPVQSGEAFEKHATAWP